MHLRSSILFIAVPTLLALTVQASRFDLAGCLARAAESHHNELAQCEHKFDASMEDTCVIARKIDWDARIAACNDESLKTYTLCAISQKYRGSGRCASQRLGTYLTKSECESRIPDFGNMEYYNYTNLSNRCVEENEYDCQKSC